LKQKATYYNINSQMLQEHYSKLACGSWLIILMESNHKSSPIKSERWIIELWKVNQNR
jgi:hypothetical protein